MMRRTLLILPAVVLLVGCLSVPTKRYFQIVALPVNADSHPALSKALYVEPVRVDPLYDDFRIIYRVSLYELKYYSYVFWAKKPDTLFREAIGDYLLKMGGFGRVQLDVLRGDPDIVLRSNLRLVEEIDNTKMWFGRLAMDLEFLEFKSGRSLIRHSFDRRLPLPARRTRFLPSVLSTILREELDVAVGKLAEALKEKEAPQGIPPFATSAFRSPRATSPWSRAGRRP